MKLLKNGFAFAIALLTITLTIAAYAGAFKAEPKKIAQGFCDNSTFDTDTPLRDILTSGCPIIDPCQDDIPVEDLAGFQNSYEPFECLSGNTFCCANLGDLENLCPTLTGEREVLAYICGQPE